MSHQNSNHCAYCGTVISCNSVNRVCEKHQDLPALDAGWNKFLYADYWLSRYSLDEIRELAAGFTDDFYELREAA